MLENRSLVLVPLRDPVDRLVSAFYMHRQNQRLEPFLRFADDPFSTDKSAAAIRRSALMGDGHMAKGWCWYLGGLLHELETSTVRVTWADQCAQDYESLRPTLGVRALGKEVHVKDWKKKLAINRTFPNAATPEGIRLTEEQRRKLTLLLEHEYWLVGRLRRLRDARGGMPDLPI